jgi:hypothetical protein
LPGWLTHMERNFRWYMETDKPGRREAFLSLATWDC